MDEIGLVYEGGGNAAVHLMQVKLCLLIRKELSRVIRTQDFNVLFKRAIAKVPNLRGDKLSKMLVENVQKAFEKDFNRFWEKHLNDLESVSSSSVSSASSSLRDQNTWKPTGCAEENMHHLDAEDCIKVIEELRDTVEKEEMMIAFDMQKLHSQRKLLDEFNKRLIKLEEKYEGELNDERILAILQNAKTGN